LAQAHEFVTRAGFAGLGQGELQEVLRCTGDRGDGASLSYGAFVGLLVGLKQDLARRVRCGGLMHGWLSKALDLQRLLKSAPSFPLDGKGWRRLRHPHLKRWFYFHAESGRASWAVPEEIKLALPSASGLEAKVKSEFSPEEARDLERQFCLMDLDRGGTISEDELGWFLCLMLGERVSRRDVQALLKGDDMYFYQMAHVYVGLKRVGDSKTLWSRARAQYLAKKAELGAEVKREFAVDRKAALRRRSSGGVVLSESVPLPEVGWDFLVPEHGEICFCGCLKQGR
jgi:hypothetical protein